MGKPMPMVDGSFQGETPQFPITRWLEVSAAHRVLA